MTSIEPETDPSDNADDEETSLDNIPPVAEREVRAEALVAARELRSSAFGALGRV